MSIAHSIMLLVTLLFVFTTRGITLDVPLFGRNGSRNQLSLPITSPFKRPFSTSLSQPHHLDGDMDHSQLFRGRTRGTIRPSSVQSTRSAPASPITILDPCDSPPLSLLNRFETPSDDDQLAHSDSEVPTTLRTDSEDFFDKPGETDCSTPTSTENMYQHIFR